MDIRINIEGLKETRQWLDALANNQLAYGVAKGLTDLANAARDEVVWDLPNRFTLRTAWWQPRSKYGFNVERATKKDHRATIYTRAPWMQLQEEGGIKRAPGRVAIPTRGDNGIRRTKRDLIPANMKPHALGPKAFKIPTRSGQQMLAMKVGKARQSKLRFLYTLKQQVHVPARLHFYETVLAFVNRNGNKYILAGIDHALRTAK